MISRLAGIIVLWAGCVLGQPYGGGGGVPYQPPLYPYQNAIFIAASDAPSEVRRQAKPEYRCDGTADNVQIQAAINELTNANDGGIIQLSQGTFRTSATILIYGGQTLRGVGHGISAGTAGATEQGTTIRLANSSNCDVIQFTKSALEDHNYFGGIERLAICGNEIGQTNSAAYDGIYIDANCSDIRIYDVFVYDTENDGIYIANNTWNLFLDNVWIEACGRYGLYCFTNRKMFASNIFFNDCDSYCIALTRGCYEMNFSNIMIETTDLGGISITEANGLECREINFNNVFIKDLNTTGGTAYGIYIRSANALTDSIHFNNLAMNDISGWTEAAVAPANNTTDDLNIGLTTSSDGIYPTDVTFTNCAFDHGGGVVIENGCYPNFVNCYGAPATNPRFVRYDNVLAADVDLIVTSVDLAAGARTIAAQPDCPRNITADLTDADSSVGAFTIAIVGVDSLGQYRTETLTFTANAGTAQQVGNYPFATITSATVSAVTGATGDDHLTMGISDKVGLPCPLGAATDVYKMAVNEVNTTVPTCSATYHTVDISASTTDGAKDFNFWYRAIK